MRWVVSAPTAIANAQRMTSVSSADPPASRQRIGIRSSAEDVARAADRMEESGLTAGFQLASQVRHEHLDGVRRREGIVAPDLLEEALSRHDDALVAQQVLEQPELALGQLDRELPALDHVRVGVGREVGD